MVHGNKQFHIPTEKKQREPTEFVHPQFPKIVDWDLCSLSLAILPAAKIQVCQIPFTYSEMLALLVLHGLPSSKHIIVLKIYLLIWDVGI